MIDLRYYSSPEPLCDLCSREGINKVIILLNAETLGEESGLRTLRMGITN